MSSPWLEAFVIYFGIIMVLGIILLCIMILPVIGAAAHEWLSIRRYKRYVSNLPEVEPERVTT